MATAMLLPDLPTELLDHIVDLLHDETDALKGCCLVSKSWIPRTRKYLFADVKFRTMANLQAWKKLFPDPSTSPAFYAKSLFVGCHTGVTASDAEEGGWIWSFSRVVHLKVYIHEAGSYCSDTSLVPFHGLSPTITSLDITFVSFPCLPIFNLIYSFPLLEDLTLVSHYMIYNSGDPDEQLAIAQLRNAPAFSGSLMLSVWGGMGSIVPQLLSLTDFFHFQKLTLALRREDEDLMATAMVERCSSTLESLTIDCCETHESHESIDLSKATKLRSVEFLSRLDPRWIIVTLRTIVRNHRPLQLSIGSPFMLGTGGAYPPDPGYTGNNIGQATYLEWLELDRILVQLRESHSIHLKVLLWADEQKAKSWMECLLPEVMAGGTVCLEKLNRQTRI